MQAFRSAGLGSPGQGARHEHRRPVGGEAHTITESRQGFHVNRNWKCNTLQSRRGLYMRRSRKCDRRETVSLDIWIHTLIPPHYEAKSISSGLASQSSCQLTSMLLVHSSRSADSANSRTDDFQNLKICLLHSSPLNI